MHFFHELVICGGWDSRYKAYVGLAGPNNEIEAP